MPIIKDWIFVHIPRTGGTYIESLFNLQWEADSDKDDNEKNREKLFGLYRHKGRLFTLQHLTATEIEQNFDEHKGCKQFTIVRNPYHRAVSLWLHHKTGFLGFSFSSFLYLLYKKKFLNIIIAEEQVAITLKGLNTTLSHSIFIHTMRIIDKW